MNIKKFSLTFLDSISIGGHSFNSREILFLSYEVDRKKITSEASPLPLLSLETVEQVAQDAKKINFTEIFKDVERFLNDKKNSAEFTKNNFLNYDFSKWTSYPSLQWGLCSLFSSYFRKNNFNRKIFFQGLLQGSPNEIISKSKKLEENKFKFAKLKVARNNKEEDLIKNILSETKNIKLRLDANSSLSLEQAIHLTKGANQNRIDYFEEPLRDFSLLSEYCNQSNISYAIDENFEKLKKQNVVHQSALKALIIKPTLVGDFFKIQKRIDFARKINPEVKIIISSSYESSLGIKNLCRLAHAISPNEHHGLDTYDIFLEKICEIDVQNNTISFDNNDQLLGPIYV